MYSVPFESGRKDAVGVARRFDIRYPEAGEHLIYVASLEGISMPHHVVGINDVPRINIGTPNDKKKLPSMKADLSLTSNRQPNGRCISFMLSGFKKDDRPISVGRPVGELSQFATSPNVFEAYDALRLVVLPDVNELVLRGLNSYNQTWIDLRRLGSRERNGTPLDPFYFANACFLGAGKTSKDPTIQVVD